VTPDWQPVLGPAPGVEGLYLALGFSGHGFKLAPSVGALLAQLITTGEAPELHAYRPTRFAEGALNRGGVRGGRWLGNRQRRVASTRTALTGSAVLVLRFSVFA
jgi:hypothetical protein